jgi:outer membrane immunogenic protein
MTKFLLSAAAILIFSPAVAADMGVPVRKAPIAPMAAYNWTGLYVGAHVGAAWGDFLRTADDGTVLNDYNNTSWMAGGQAGYRWQFNNFVLGVEVSGAGTDIDARAPCPSASFTCHTSVDWLFLAGGQAGLAFDRTLLYISGGYAATRTSTSSIPFFAGFNSSSDHGGWYIGGGIDFGFAPNWTIGVEYAHAEFESKRYADPTAANIPYTVDPQIDLVRVKLNYRFGGSVARY